MQVKRKMAELDVKFYVIDARAVAEKAGLGKFVNMVMQTVFFQVSGVLPIDKAIGLLKKSIEKAYSRKGPEVCAVAGWIVQLSGCSNWDGDVGSCLRQLRAWRC